MSEYKGTGSDDFWDISKLVPKSRPTMKPFSTRPAAVSYEVDTPPTSTRSVENSKAPTPRDEVERRISPEIMRGVRESIDETYYPLNMGLIKRVTIKRFVDKYDFYDSFRKSAILYFDYKTPRCDFAQYYSYMPQYSQLTPTQKNYYFFWRDEVRHGRFIKSDYSYIYLYVYEILNLPDKIPPEEGIRALCRVWREYRRDLPRLDLYFSVWIEDYCLVHQLPSPTEEVSSFLFDCIDKAPLKEFYLKDVRDVGFAGIEPLLAYLSDYDWRRGKFAGGACENSALMNGEGYKKHMEKAMYLLLSTVWRDAVENNGRTTVITRDAFPNSLCTHTVKCKLEIEYFSLSDAEDVRNHVTAAVRYTENKLRALLGVKSRLAVRELPDGYKRIIDSYFDVYMKAEEKRRREEMRPEYERLYEAPRTELSFTGADEIELASWKITERLTEYSGEKEDAPTASAYLNHQNSTDDLGAYRQNGITTGDDTVFDSEDMHLSYSMPPRSGADNTADAGCDIPDTVPDRDIHGNDGIGDTYGLTAEEILYLKEVLAGSARSMRGIAEQSAVERINEAFTEILGDVVLEGDCGEYSIIEDYREDVEKWLCSLQK